jgi:hypothetical protein
MARNTRLLRSGHGETGGRILAKLVAQRPKRNAEKSGRVGPVSMAMIERVEDEAALNLGDGSPDERAGVRRGAIGEVRCSLPPGRAQAFGFGRCYETAGRRASNNHDSIDLFRSRDDASGFKRCVVGPDFVWLGLASR